MAPKPQWIIINPEIFEIFRSAVPFLLELLTPLDKPLVYLPGDWVKARALGLADYALAPQASVERAVAEWKQADDARAVYRINGSISQLLKTIDIYGLARQTGDASWLRLASLDEAVKRLRDVKGFGLRTSAVFDNLGYEQRYLAYPETWSLKENALGAFEHFLLFGARAGHIATAHLDNAWYYMVFPEWRQVGPFATLAWPQDTAKLRGYETLIVQFWSRNSNLSLRFLKTLVESMASEVVRVIVIADDVFLPDIGRIIAGQMQPHYSFYVPEMLNKNARPTIINWTAECLTLHREYVPLPRNKFLPSTPRLAILMNRLMRERGFDTSTSNHKELGIGMDKAFLLLPAPSGMKGFSLAPGNRLQVTDSRCFDQLLVAGWSTQEPDGVWSEGEKSTLRIVLPEPPNDALDFQLEFSTFLHAPKHAVLNCRIYVNGECQERWELTDAYVQKRAIRINPKDVSSENVIEVNLQFENPCAPAWFELNDDHRCIGIFLRSISIEPLAGGSPGELTVGCMIQFSDNIVQKSHAFGNWLPSASMGIESMSSNDESRFKFLLPDDATHPLNLVISLHLESSEDDNEVCIEINGELSDILIPEQNFWRDLTVPLPEKFIRAGTPISIGFRKATGCPVGSGLTLRAAALLRDDNVTTSLAALHSSSYVLGEEIDFSLSGNSDLFEPKGWYHPEAFGRWIGEDQATLTLHPLQACISYRLLLVVHPYLADGRKSSVSVLVSADGLEISRLALSKPGFQKIEIVFSRAVEKMWLPLVLRLHALNPSSPTDTGGDDIRILGVALKSLTLFRA